MPHLTKRPMFNLGGKRCALALAVFCASTGLSHAQQIEEIVVTAQKRSQNLQDVPIALNVYGEEFIQNTGIRSVADLEQFTPGLETGNQVTQPSYTIRGIGTSDFGLGADPAVGVYIDGVYVGRSGGAELPFTDIALIEVLKGPQGTLFGRNTAAGAIQVKTFEPSTASTEGKVRLRFDNYDEKLAEGMFNLPVTDSFALRFNALGRTRDGDIDAVEGRDLGNKDDTTFRVSALWAFSDDGSIRYTYDNNRVDQDAATWTSINDESPDGNDPFGKISQDVFNNEESRDLEAHSLVLNYELDFAELSYVASYRQFDTLNRQDEDGFDRTLMPFPYSQVYLDTANIESSEQHYHEFRLTNDGDTMQWTAGVSFYDENGLQRSDVNALTNTVSAIYLFSDPPILHPLPAEQVWTEYYRNTLDSTSYAAFGDVTWNVTDALNLTVGLRYTKDEKDFTWFNGGNNIDPDAPNVAFEDGEHPVKDELIKDDGSWENVSPRLVVDYRWTDNLMTFISYAQGYKAGGFNALAQGEDGTRYEEENVENLELGMRSEWFERRLVLNTSLYHYRYDDRQGTVLDKAEDGASRYLTTTGDAKGTGVDLDITWLIAQGLTAKLAYGYLDAEWTDYEVDGDDLSGEALTTPKHQAAFSIAYLQDLGDIGTLQYYFDYTYASKQQHNSASPQKRYGADYDTVDDSFSNANARITWGDSEGALELALWAQNLFDEEYATDYKNLYPSFLENNIDVGATIRNRPRSVGVEAIYNF